MIKLKNGSLYIKQLCVATLYHSHSNYSRSCAVQLALHVPCVKVAQNSGSGQIIWDIKRDKN